MNKTHCRPFVSQASLVTFHAGRIITDQLQRHGITDLMTCHGDILSKLYREDGLTVTELATRTKRTKSTVSVLVYKLVKLGYVEKRASEFDARALAVCLTPKALEIKPIFEEVSEKLNAIMQAALTEEEAQTLEELLNKLIEPLVAN